MSHPVFIPIEIIGQAILRLLVDEIADRIAECTVCLDGVRLCAYHQDRAKQLLPVCDEPDCWTCLPATTCGARSPITDRPCILPAGHTEQHAMSQPQAETVPRPAPRPYPQPRPRPDPDPRPRPEPHPDACGLLTDRPCRLAVDHPQHAPGCPRERVHDNGDYHAS